MNADNPIYGTEGGNDTQDYVSLLSWDEMLKYFTVVNINDGIVLGRNGNGDLICMPTQHAADGGVSTLSADKLKEYQSGFSYELREGACWWWLRSPGEESKSAACVSNTGNIYSSTGYGCDRPLMVMRF